MEQNNTNKSKYANTNIDINALNSHLKTYWVKNSAIRQKINSKHMDKRIIKQNNE